MTREYLSRGSWEYTTVPQLWDECARRYPDREALVDSRVRLTWAQAKRAIDRLALSLLEMGVRKDQVIAIQLPNCAELLLARVACEKAGALALTVIRNLRETEMAHALKHTEAVGVIIPWRHEGRDYFQMIQELQPELPALQHVMVAGDETPPEAISLQEMLERPLERKYPPHYLDKTQIPPDEVGSLAHTSGSTGLPKIVEDATFPRVATARSQLERLGWRADDVVGVIAPAIGGAAKTLAFLGAPMVGARLALLERFDAEQALRIIDRERVTIVCAVPAQISMMVDHPNLDNYDLSSLRLITVATAPLLKEVAVKAEKQLGAIILNLYGGMDVGGLCVATPHDPEEVRLNTIGKPLRGVELTLRDEQGHEVPRGEVGTIWVRGPILSSGYFKNPQATQEGWKDGWFNMGDLARFDDRGNLRLVGRSKDVIIRGGHNIYPVELENLLSAHPKVKEVAIVGMPDPVLGERACAYVVPRTEDGLTFEEMVSYLKEKQIASYKLPERLEVVSELPLASEQKVDKKSLREDIARKLEAEVGLKTT
jgi:non-ribosomal peptide synthetase component E (peptide arylation enzyme)